MPLTLITAKAAAQPHQFLQQVDASSVPVSLFVPFLVLATIPLCMMLHQEAPRGELLYMNTERALASMCCLVLDAVACNRKHQEVRQLSFVGARIIVWQCNDHLQAIIAHVESSPCVLQGIQMDLLPIAVLVGHLYEAVKCVMPPG